MIKYLQFQVTQVNKKLFMTGGDVMGNSKIPFYVNLMALHPEVTGSCILGTVKLPYEEKTYHFAIDCGLFQEDEYREYNYEINSFNPEKLDFVLVTHNHVDHVGRLPMLIRKGYRGPIYCTEVTKSILNLALFDTLRIIKGTAKKFHTKLMYDEEDVANTIGQTMGVHYDVNVQINEHIKFTFLSNGHLLGSAMILLQISYPGEQDINILFTGDYNNKNMFFDVSALPKWVRKLPITVVQECTYGYMKTKEIVPVFNKNVIDAIENNNSVLLLAFSLGRSQEVLYTLKQMQDNGTLPTYIPIYFDGKLAHKYTKIYMDDELEVELKCKEFLPQNLEWVTDKEMRNVLLELLRNKQDQMIVVTSSGMGSYGPAQVYIPKFIVEDDALIHFTGYTAEGTLGRRLKEAEYGETVTVGGQILVKKAKVEYTSEFSAHAKADELIDFLKKFSNLRSVLLNHGRAEVITQFGKEVIAENICEKVYRLSRDYYFKITNHGVIKTAPTHFK